MDKKRVTTLGKKTLVRAIALLSLGATLVGCPQKDSSQQTQDSTSSESPAALTEPNSNSAVTPIAPSPSESPTIIQPPPPMPEVQTPIAPVPRADSPPLPESPVTTQQPSFPESGQTPVAQKPEKVPPLPAGEPQSQPPKSARYLQVGFSDMDGIPIYLDRQSIISAGKTSYKYILRSQGADSGPHALDTEEDVVVDCSQPTAVKLVETRFYDKAGSLHKTEKLNDQQVDGLPSADPYSVANSAVCRRANQ